MVDRPRTFTPGTAGFTVVLAMAMAINALAIDSVLPAFPEIRADLGLGADSTAVAGLVTAFLIGSGLGLMPAGLLADRFGRRPVLWGGVAIYIVGATAAALAPTLGWMLVARFVWGLGAAGPRVAAMAMVRDAYEGEQMARQMSLMMAVFLVVPTIAPTISAGLISIGPWQLAFWMCVAMALLVLVLSMRLPATMPVEQRRALSASEVWKSCKTVLAAPGTYGYLLAMSGLFSAFISYLASSEIIIDEVFGLGKWFPAIFGGSALVIGAAMLLNGRLVERAGLDRMNKWLVRALILAEFVLLAVAFATDGKPPFWLFIVVLMAVLCPLQVLVPNLNSAAMRPLGTVAGTATALLGMIPMVVGSLIGSFIDRAFNGTITPIAIGFAISGIIGAIGIGWANTATRRSVDVADVAEVLVS